MDQRITKLIKMYKALHWVMTWTDYTSQGKDKETQHWGMCECNNSETWRIYKKEQGEIISKQKDYNTSGHNETQYNRNY